MATGRRQFLSQTFSVGTAFSIAGAFSSLTDRLASGAGSESAELVDDPLLEGGRPELGEGGAVEHQRLGAESGQRLDQPVEQRRPSAPSSSSSASPTASAASPTAHPARSARAGTRSPSSAPTPTTSSRERCGWSAATRRSRSTNTSPRGRGSVAGPPMPPRSSGGPGSPILTPRPGWVLTSRSAWSVGERG